jgi:hypothetical protein
MSFSVEKERFSLKGEVFFSDFSIQFLARFPLSPIAYCLLPAPVAYCIA